MKWKTSEMPGINKIMGKIKITVMNKAEAMKRVMNKGGYRDEYRS